MGYGEVVGNASVHWKVCHEDERGRETTTVRARDPIDFEDIGAKSNKKGVAAKRAAAKSLFSKPSFKVRLRYATKDEAQRAKDSAQIVQQGDSYFLLLAVPAVKRKADKVEPAQPPAEVRIDW